MKTYFLCTVAVILLLFSTGCAATSEPDAGTTPGAPAESQASVPAPANGGESVKSDDSGSGASSALTGNPSGESAPQPDNQNPVTDPAPGNDSPATPSVPAIRVEGFYDENEEGANLSILCTGMGRYWLSYEHSKQLLDRMDFTGFTPTDQTDSLGIDSPDPGIVFTAPDFSCELRLDQNTGVAVYEIGLDTRYYYRMPEGFYAAAYELVAAYAQYDYNGEREIEIDEDGNWNV